MEIKELHGLSPGPQYPLEDSDQWLVGGSLNYNTVLQLDRFCRKKKKRETGRSSICVSLFLSVKYAKLMS